MTLVPQNAMLQQFTETPVGHTQRILWQQRLDSLKEKRQLLNLPPLTQDEWQRLSGPLVLSHYLYEQLLRFPQWLEELLRLEADALMAQLPQLSDIFADGNAPLALDEKQLMSRLRRLRQYSLVRLIYLDCLHAISLPDLTRFLTRLADTCVQASLVWSAASYRSLYGIALDSQGRTQTLIVIGMGKLGGGELNLSSDIDLIFAYREHGETVQGKKSISHQEYFTKIGQKLIQHLDAHTIDGFVFRVDMRLRPYGDSGALVLNMDALENYYQDQGRDWERYAMIKARVMAGDAQDVKEFEQLRRPFVYRKYLDFGAISALRDLKKMIAKEVQRKGIEHNIKLGEGGIREVEFIVQALQILHGGRNSTLQTASLYHVLPALGQQGYLPIEQTEALWQAYQLLRRTEHALQARKDEQTQLLPTQASEQAQLAALLGFDTWATLDAELWRQRHYVHQVFTQLIDDDPDDTEQTDTESWRLLLKTQGDLEALAELMPSIPWLESSASLSRLHQFVVSKGVAYMQPIGQERLAQFLASFIPKLVDEAWPDQVLERVLLILDAILRRTAYLVLLCENPTAITHLLRLCRESAWFAEAISTTPMLLDELLDANTLFSPPNKDSMQQELQQTLLRLPQDDEEANMDAMRRFRRSLLLRIAACDITDILPLMKVSDHLTWLAEVLLAQVLQQAWHYMTQRHGYPTDAEQNPLHTPQLVIVGYGKSGGWELGYDSDLDLVFLHHADRSQSTNGTRSIDNLTFYTRLGQRIIHLLTSYTPSGRLYEVDMRLRPSGNSGLLVTSLTAFNDYQRNDAWVWEHQALTRARALAGEAALVADFNASRAAILSQVRDQEALKTEVITMREKMRQHLDTGQKQDGFDIKQGPGGIIDIEFMVQYLVLAWSHDYPQLLTYSDNIRQLETAADVGLLDVDTVTCLIDSYKLYRAHTHRLTLQKQGRVIAKEILQEQQKVVSAIWQRLMLEPEAG